LPTKGNKAEKPIVAQKRNGIEAFYKPSECPHTTGHRKHNTEGAIKKPGRDKRPSKILYMPLELI
jgi:hypothetical protein